MNVCNMSTAKMEYIKSANGIFVDYVICLLVLNQTEKKV